MPPFSRMVIYTTCLPNIYTYHVHKAECRTEKSDVTKSQHVEHYYQYPQPKFFLSADRGHAQR